MKKYGLIVADNGSDMYVSGTYDTRWNNDVLNPGFRCAEGERLRGRSARLGSRRSSFVLTLPATRRGRCGDRDADGVRRELQRRHRLHRNGAVHIDRRRGHAAARTTRSLRGDAGTHTFPAGFILRTAGSQIVTVHRCRERHDHAARRASRSDRRRRRVGHGHHDDPGQSDLESVGRRHAIRGSPGVGWSPFTSLTVTSLTSFTNSSASARERATCTRCARSIPRRARRRLRAGCRDDDPLHRRSARCRRHPHQGDASDAAPGCRKRDARRRRPRCLHVCRSLFSLLRSL